MAPLNGTFDATGVEPAEPVRAAAAREVPRADHRERDAADQGRRRPVLKLVLEVLDGPYRAAQDLGPAEPGEPQASQTVEIAQRTLSAICHAVGQMQVSRQRAAALQADAGDAEVEPAGNDKHGVWTSEARNKVNGYAAASAPRRAPAPRPRPASPGAPLRPAAAPPPPPHRRRGDPALAPRLIAAGRPPAAGAPSLHADQVMAATSARRPPSPPSTPPMRRRRDAGYRAHLGASLIGTELRARHLVWLPLGHAGAAHRPAAAAVRDRQPGRGALRRRPAPHRRHRPRRRSRRRGGSGRCAMPPATSAAAWTRWRSACPRRRRPGTSASSRPTARSPSPS